MSFTCFLCCLSLSLFSVYLIYCIVRQIVEYQLETAFGRRHGCQLPPELPKRLPLGIDRIKNFGFPIQKVNSSHFFARLQRTMNLGITSANIFCSDLEPSTYCIQRTWESLSQSILKLDYEFGSRAGVFAPLIGKGIITQEGLPWKHSRERLRKQFVRARYQDLEQFREHVDNLIAHLPKAGVLDLQPLFFSLTLDTTTALIFGKSVYSLRAATDQDAENALFAESFNIAQEGLAKRFRIAPWHFFYNPPAFKRACRIVHRYVERYIESRNLRSQKSNVPEESDDFIDQVATESTTVEELRDQLVNVLLAGRDTTAYCLSWTFRLLVRHPTVMRKLRKEIFQIMSDSELPTRDHVKRMPYLACVIKESLRVYPPVPLNNRTAKNTTILPIGGGPEGRDPILVRKGELVVFSPYVNSRVKSIYGQDAHDFNPDRWDSGKLSNIGWAYFPFNGGPRRCLGEDFALMEISYTIIRLIRATTNISLPQGEEGGVIGSEKQRLTLVLAPADGCRVRIDST